MLAFITDFVLLFVLWLLFTWSLSLQDVIAGLILSLIIASISSKLFSIKHTRLLNPFRMFWFLLYIPYFLWYLVIANFDVAYRVLHPNLPIRPGIIKFKTTLVSPLAKTVLANSITLTPGTMTVDSIGEYMYIHWINVKGEREEEWYRHVAGRFEGFIKRIFE